MKKIIILTHYYYPDPVAASMQYYQLSQELVKNNFDVTVISSNRIRHNINKTLQEKSNYNNVKVIRLFRPNLDQNKVINKIISSLWMTLSWSFFALKNRKKINPDYIISGTDPAFSLVSTFFWNTKSKKPKHIHWCFDLYPDVIVEQGLVKKNSILNKLFSLYFKKIYKSMDLLVDSSDCQKVRLKNYIDKNKKIITCNPWALIETKKIIKDDYDQKEKIFGKVDLSFLYSGSINFGRNFDSIFQLASDLDNFNCKFGISAISDNHKKIKSRAKERGVDILCLDFVPFKELINRMSIIDFNLVLLEENWTGTLIPSKFFGSIALGRPVIYCGSDKSLISHLIKKYKIGYILNNGNYKETLSSLIELTKDSSKIKGMKRNSFNLYKNFFSKKINTTRFVKEINNL